MLASAWGVVRPGRCADWPSGRLAQPGTGRRSGSGPAGTRSASLAMWRRGRSAISSATFRQKRSNVSEGCVLTRVQLQAWPIE